MTKKQKKALTHIIAAAVLLVVLELIPTTFFGSTFGSFGRWVRLALYLAAYYIIGWDILCKAWKGIKNHQVFDECFLMAVATIGALALAIYKDGFAMEGDYVEAIGVMLFYQIGEFFQSYAVGKSRRNISELMDIRPDYANVEHDGVLEKVDPDEVEIGTVIVVQPGEKVPIDGIVEEGTSSLNTSALTGESVPREAKPGDEIISGCINLNGVLKIRTTKEFGESTVSKILDLVENASSHPISKSLQTAYGKPLDRGRVSNIQEISGEGITALVDGHTVACGNRKLMQRLGMEYHDCHKTGTIVHVAIDGSYAGHIVISDLLKPTAKPAMEALRHAGITKTVMLTGDIDAVAQATAKELGIDTVYSELLPGDKVHKVEELLEEKHRGKLAFVGDGINDAPVLSRADIGIAMGAMGSDAAIEAADVVLMDDDPVQIAKAVKISRKCLRIVHQNIVFAIGIKVICLILGAFGIANMWFAIFADVGVMILAVLNAIRALMVKNL